MFENALGERIDEARKDCAFQNYQRVRQDVLTLLNEGNYDISPYWAEEVAGFEYLFDASPLIVDKLRHHCYHISGVRENEYRDHHVHAQPGFAAKIEQLRRLDRQNLKIGEPGRLGGFGHCIGGAMVNIDTLKYYEILIGLDRAGIWEKLGSFTRVVEIGGGWGGLAQQILTNHSDIKYAIVDLPQTLLFSGTYLKTLWPGKSVEIVSTRNQMRNVDIALVSADNYLDVIGDSFDLAINSVSFQEMSNEHVDAYAQWVSQSNALLYSLNRERSPHADSDFSGVATLLAPHLQLSEIDFMPEGQEYWQLWPPARRNARSMIKRILRRDSVFPNRYRHLVGRSSSTA